jgi:hypothetical protein
MKGSPGERAAPAAALFEHGASEVEMPGRRDPITGATQRSDRLRVGPVAARRSGILRLVVAAGTLLLASGLTSGCTWDVVGPGAADPRLRTAIVPDAAWERVARPGFGGGTGFSIAIPPGFEDAGLQPIDSDARKYVRAGASLNWDFGPYTSRPGKPSGSGVVTQRIRIGGRVATVQAYRDADGRYVYRAWFGDVGRGQAGTNHLMLRGEYTDPADGPELLAAIYSVQFE